VDDYIVAHFAHEEKIMDQYHCPIADINRQAHTKFIEKFKTIKEKYNTAGSNVSIVLEMSDTINNWLIDHIKKIDSQLGKCTPADPKKPALTV
jgi:hemerythrin